MKAKNALIIGIAIISALMVSAWTNSTPINDMVDNDNAVFATLLDAPVANEFDDYEAILNDEDEFGQFDNTKPLQDILTSYTTVSIPNTRTLSEVLASYTAAAALAQFSEIQGSNNFSEYTNVSFEIAEFGQMGNIKPLQDILASYTAVPVLSAKSLPEILTSYTAITNFSQTTIIPELEFSDMASIRTLEFGSFGNMKPLQDILVSYTGVRVANSQSMQNILASYTSTSFE
jgi:hypothetical protein